MKTVVVYKSISGFTKKYAEWIADDLETECVDISDLRGRALPEDTVVVFGGSLHAIGINGYAKLRRYLAGRKIRELVVFAVGASPAKPGVEEEIKRANFTTAGEKAIRLYYLRGGFDFYRLDPLNKVLMTLFRLKIKAKREEDRNPDERGMLASYDAPLDAAKRENIREIVEYARSAAC